MKIINKITLIVLAIISASAIAATTDQNKAKAYFFTAETAYEEKQYKDALMALSKVEGFLGKSNDKISALRVKILFDQKNYAEARLELDRFFSFEKINNNRGKEMSAYLLKVDKAIQAAADAKRAREQARIAKQAEEKRQRDAQKLAEAKKVEDARLRAERTKEVKADIQSSVNACVTAANCTVAASFHPNRSHQAALYAKACELNHISSCKKAVSYSQNDGKKKNYYYRACQAKKGWACKAYRQFPVEAATLFDGYCFNDKWAPACRALARIHKNPSAEYLTNDKGLKALEFACDQLGSYYGCTGVQNHYGELTRRSSGKTRKKYRKISTRWYKKANKLNRECKSAAVRAKKACLQTF